MAANLPRYFQFFAISEHSFQENQGKPKGRCMTVLIIDPGAARVPHIN